MRIAILAPVKVHWLTPFGTVDAQTIIGIGMMGVLTQISAAFRHRPRRHH
jgi:hypothetical protein